MSETLKVSWTGRTRPWRSCGPTATSTTRAARRSPSEAYALLGSGVNRLLLDLERTKIVNSIGISILIEILEKVLDQGGKLAFCRLTPTIEKTFQIMGLAQYARIFPAPEPALAWLRGESE